MPKQAVCQPITPEPPPVPMPTAKKIRAAVEAHLAAVEHLIAILDGLEVDPDLEHDGCHDEPSLGSNESRDGGTSWGGLGPGYSGFDCEDDPCDSGELDHEDEYFRQPAMLDGLLLPEPNDAGRRTAEYLGCASPITFRKPLTRARR